MSNSIVIGGPIAVGKSTLVEKLPFISVPELDENDKLQHLLLKMLYQGDPIVPQIFQLDVLLTRFDKYKKLANSNDMHVFDRSIFEDIYFAKKLFSGDAPTWDYYFSIWKDKVTELLNEVGSPKHYIILNCSWQTFKDRLFVRNREAEVKNFGRNESYFQELLSDYTNFVSTILDEHQISYSLINTDNLEIEDVFNTSLNILKERNII